MRLTLTTGKVAAKVAIVAEEATDMDVLATGVEVMDAEATGVAAAINSVMDVDLSQCNGDVSPTNLGLHLWHFGYCCPDWTSNPYFFKISVTALLLTNDKNCSAVSLLFDERRMTHACLMGG